MNDDSNLNVENLPDYLTGYDDELLRDKVERYNLSRAEAILLAKDFDLSINKRLGSTLDYGDIEYFSIEQCKELIKWINENPKITNKDDRLHLYKTLLRFAEYTIKSETAGIVIEL